MKYLILSLFVVFASFGCNTKVSDSKKSTKSGEYLSQQNTGNNFSPIALKKILTDTTWITATFSEWGLYFTFNNNNTINIKFEPCCPPMGNDVPQSETDAYNAKVKHFKGYYFINDNCIETNLNGEKVKYLFVNNMKTISQVDSSYFYDIKLLEFPMLIPLNKKGNDNYTYKDYKNYILVNHF